MHLFNYIMIVVKYVQVVYLHHSYKICSVTSSFIKYFMATTKKQKWPHHHIVILSIACPLQKYKKVEHDPH